MMRKVQLVHNEVESIRFGKDDNHTNSFVDLSPSIVNFKEIFDFCGENAYKDLGALLIKTPKGEEELRVGYYVVKEVDGFYVYSLPDFLIKYKEV